ncbi:hypothetical protein TNCV_91901 [Trichonephila clavipes]|nr:hypothetical protein TNCV_91901 [Trichonephila clavipes]
MCHPQPAIFELLSSGYDRFVNSLHSSSLSLIVFKTFKNKELWRSNFVAGGGGKFMSPQNIRAAALPFPIALIPYVNLRLTS